MNNRGFVSNQLLFPAIQAAWALAFLATALTTHASNPSWGREDGVQGKRRDSRLRTDTGRTPERPRAELLKGGAPPAAQGSGRKGPPVPRGSSKSNKLHALRQCQEQLYSKLPQTRIAEALQQVNG